MKLIEALKESKDILRKIDDLTNKIKAHTAVLSYETPLYADQKAQVDSWVQARNDLIKLVLQLRFRIQKTNIVTPVTVTLGDKSVTRSIAEWIHRKKDLAKLEAAGYQALTDGGRKEGQIIQTTGQPMQVTIRRFYDPKERDEKLNILTAEPSKIDAALEMVNATTELMDQ